MKRATINAKFPSVVAHQAELSAAAIATSNQAAISAAVRKLLSHPQLKGKQIHSIQMTVSLINLDQKTIEAMLDKADGIQAEAAEEEEEEPDPNKCRYCGASVESLSRHLASCEQKPQLNGARK